MWSPQKNWIIPKAVRTKLDNVEKDVKKLKQKYPGKNMDADTQVETVYNLFYID